MSTRYVRDVNNLIRESIKQESRNQYRIALLRSKLQPGERPSSNDARYTLGVTDDPSGVPRLRVVILNIYSKFNN